jgi:hypothetical protein
MVGAFWDGTTSRGSPQRQRPRETIARDIADIRNLVICTQADGVLSAVFTGKHLFRRALDCPFVPSELVATRARRLVHLFP